MRVIACTILLSGLVSIKCPEGSTNPEEDAILIPGQGKEDVCPARKGKCGFAITSDHPNFELIANARVPTQDTEAFFSWRWNGPTAKRD